MRKANVRTPGKSDRKLTVLVRWSQETYNRLLRLREIRSREENRPVSLSQVVIEMVEKNLN